MVGDSTLDPTLDPARKKCMQVEHYTCLCWCAQKCGNISVVLLVHHAEIWSTSSNLRAAIAIHIDIKPDKFIASPFNTLITLRSLHVLQDTP